MGINLSETSDKFREKINASERKALGKVAMTSTDAEEKRTYELEKDLHNDFIQWLNLNEFPYERNRMDKRSTGTKGEPDFKVYKNNRVAFVEFKADDGRLSDDQKERIEQLEKGGNVVLVTRDLQTAIGYVRQTLNAPDQTPRTKHHE